MEKSLDGWPFFQIGMINQETLVLRRGDFCPPEASVYLSQKVSLILSAASSARTRRHQPLECLVVVLASARRMRYIRTIIY